MVETKNRSHNHRFYYTDIFSLPPLKSVGSKWWLFKCVLVIFVCVSCIGLCTNVDARTSSKFSNHIHFSIGINKVCIMKELSIWNDDLNAVITTIIVIIMKDTTFRKFVYIFNSSLWHSALLHISSNQISISISIYEIANSQWSNLFTQSTNNAFI